MARVGALDPVQNWYLYYYNASVLKFEFQSQSGFPPGSTDSLLTVDFTTCTDIHLSSSQAEQDRTAVVSWICHFCIPALSSAHTLEAGRPVPIAPLPSLMIFL
jgi:hypothetical protein